MKEAGKFIFFIKYLTIELYYPHFVWNSVNAYISANTQIIYYFHNKNREWWMIRSLAIRALGFGMGFAWKHCDNPIMKENDYD